MPMTSSCWQIITRRVIGLLARSLYRGNSLNITWKTGATLEAALKRLLAVPISIATALPDAMFDAMFENVSRPLDKA